MAIYYGTEIPHVATYDFSTPNAAVDNSKVALLAGGWTNLEPMYAWITLTLSTLPTSGQWLYLKDLAGTTYQYFFQTTLTPANPREVKIGATMADCLQNLKDAISANPATSGTAYSSSTVADANWRGTTLTATTMKVEALVAGPTMAGISFFTTFGAWGGRDGTSITSDGGWKLSTLTPDGLRLKLIMIRTAAGGSDVSRYNIVLPDESDLSTWLSQNPITSANAPFPNYAGTTVRAIVSKSMVIFMNATSPTGPGSLFLAIPALRPRRKPLIVTSIANVGGLVEITTSVAHGWTTGDAVYIAHGKVAGAYSASINGSWTVTVTSTTTATLSGSTYPAGAYNSTSAIVGDSIRVAHAYVASKCYANAINILSKSWVANSPPSEGGCVGVNAARHNTGTSQWLFGLWFANICGGFTPMLTGVTNVADFYEARIGIGLSTVVYDVGLLWDCFVVHLAANVGDTLTPGPNGKTFRCIMGSTTTPSVWMRTSA